MKKQSKPIIRHIDVCLSCDKFRQNHDVMDGDGIKRINCYCGLEAWKPDGPNFTRRVQDDFFDISEWESLYLQAYITSELPANCHRIMEHMIMNKGKKHESSQKTKKA